MYDEETIPAGFESWEDFNDECNAAESEYQQTLLDFD